MAADCESAPSACSTLTRAGRSLDAGRSGSFAAGNGAGAGLRGAGMRPERVCSRRFCMAGSGAGRAGGGAGATNAGCVADDARGEAGGLVTMGGRTASFEPPSPSPVRTSEKMSSAERSGPPGLLGGPGTGVDSRTGRRPSAIATSAWKTSSVKGFSRMLVAPTRCASARLLRPL